MGAQSGWPVRIRRSSAALKTSCRACPVLLLAVAANAPDAAAYWHLLVIQQCLVEVEVEM